ncbi:MAG: chromate resistance protein [Rhodospirillales bacterium]|nr:chromate resistance protein [Rhodospirillales bacterium]
MASPVSSSTASSITAAELRDLLDRGAVSFFDVRRRARYEESGEMIPGIPWRDPEQAQSWARHIAPGRAVVVACVHGHEVSQGVAAGLAARGLAARYLEGGLEGWRQAGNPVARQAPPPKGSTWITRERPKIDRIACPWLVLRFHDPAARFVYVPPERVLAEAETSGAIPYDVPGVEFSHDGELCSFDVMLRRLGLGDPALKDLAVIVRGADTGRPELSPEAPGLLAVSLGLSALYPDDQDMLRAGLIVYDAFYAWLRKARGESHGWPPKG